MCSMQGRRKISHHSPSNIIQLYLAWSLKLALFTFYQDFIFRTVLVGLNEIISNVKIILFVLIDRAVFISKNGFLLNAEIK